MKFRKKPIVIDAEQWFPSKTVFGVIPYRNDDVTVPCWWADANGHRYPCNEDEDAFIFTLEGWMHVTAGDWITTGHGGERYPCKPSIFAVTYELVEV